MDKCEYSFNLEEITNIDKGTETDTLLYKNINKNNDDLSIYQSVRENSKKVKNSSTEKQNTSNVLSLSTCFNSKSGKENTVDKKERPLTQQRRAILAGSVGVVLLIGSIVSCILKMYIIAVVGGIVGLVCACLALCSITKPNTKLEEVEDIERSPHPSLSPS